MFYLKKMSRGHGVQFSQWRHWMENIKLYKRDFLHLFIFAKIRKSKGKGTDRHTRTEKNKALAIGAILQIFLKSRLGSGRR